MANSFEIDGNASFVGATGLKTAEDLHKIVELATFSADSNALDGTTIEAFGGRARVASLGIDTAQLADESVTTEKLADGAVTTEKLADGAVIEAIAAEGGLSTNSITGLVYSVRTSGSSVSNLAYGVNTPMELTNVVATGSESADFWNGTENGWVVPNAGIYYVAANIHMDNVNGSLTGGLNGKGKIIAGPIGNTIQWHSFWGDARSGSGGSWDPGYHIGLSVQGIVVVEAGDIVQIGVENLSETSDVQNRTTVRISAGAVTASICQLAAPPPSP